MNASGYRVPLVACSAWCLCIASCALPEPRADFDSPDPGERVRAIAHAADEGDADALPELVDCLESDDPAIRLLAIETLKRESGGETFGYECGAQALERGASVSRWRDWLATRSRR